MKTLNSNEVADLKDPALIHLVYNALDCCITRGAYHNMREIVDKDPEASTIYNAERKISIPALAVQLRGIRIDSTSIPRERAALDAAMANLVSEIRHITGVADLNPNSHQQLSAILWDKWNLVPLTNKSGNVSTDRSVLERLRDNKQLKFVPGTVGHRPDHDTVKLATSKILALRDLGKEREIYAKRLHNGRMRSTLSVGNTETWRFASSSSPMGDGTNGQNIAKARRGIFVPDPGFKMYQIDQKTAESMTVAYLCGDPDYIRIHHEGDSHIAVARIMRPYLDWPAPGTKDEYDFATAEGSGYRHLTLRALYKRGQHLLNYGGTAYTLAHALQIPLEDAHLEVDRYYSAFPGIPKWHQTIIRQIKDEGVIYYPGGYKRLILGHRNDPATHREIIASTGQSIVGWINHIAFSNIWHELDGSFLAGNAGPDLQVLMHVHDAVLFQSRSEELARRAHAIASSVEWPTPSGTMRIPWSFTPGNNWKEASD